MNKLFTCEARAGKGRIYRFLVLATTESEVSMWVRKWLSPARPDVVFLTAPTESDGGWEDRGVVDWHSTWCWDGNKWFQLDEPG